MLGASVSGWGVRRYTYELTRRCLGESEVLFNTPRHPLSLSMPTEASYHQMCNHLLYSGDIAKGGRACASTIDQSQTISRKQRFSARHRPSIGAPILGKAHIRAFGFCAPIAYDMHASQVWGSNMTLSPGGSDPPAEELSGRRTGRAVSCRTRRCRRCTFNDQPVPWVRDVWRREAGARTLSVLRH